MICADHFHVWPQCQDSQVNCPSEATAQAIGSFFHVGADCLKANDTDLAPKTDEGGTCDIRMGSPLVPPATACVRDCTRYLRPLSLC